MIKIHILDRCEMCDGEAYVFACEVIDAKGELYPRYLPCSYCQGSGEMEKWVSLREFADLLDRASQWNLTTRSSHAVCPSPNIRTVAKLQASDDAQQPLLMPVQEYTWAGSFFI